MFTQTSYQKLSKYTINIEFLIGSNDIINGNILNIPININKTQEGTDTLYIGKPLTIFINDSVLFGTYQQKLDNTEYLRINNVSQLSNQSIQFNINSLFQYTEINKKVNDSVPLTINDIKLIKPSKNQDGFKGITGLLEPLHLESIESIKFLREINQKSISELISYTTVLYYETINNENNTQIQFGVFHSLFNGEFELKIFGNNYTLKTLRFGASELLNNLSFGITINKIPSNDSSKQLYQILFKLNNIPVSVQNNVEKVKIYINENLTNQKIFATLPSNYTLSNAILFISEKLFSRYILFYDNNGVVSLNPNESIKLLSSQNLNNITQLGWYHYDVLNVSDILLNNMPVGFKNVFYLNVKRLSDELIIQYLYVYDSTNTVIKTFSRIRNNTTLIFTPWIEYVTSLHKHLATDITTSDTHQFVTQQQIDTWNSYQSSLSDYWNNAVDTISNLPTTGINGECRLVLSNLKIYTYIANDNNWVQLNSNTLTYELTSDNIKIILDTGGVNKEFNMPLVTDNNPGIVPADFHSTDYKSYFESKLNFTVENSGTSVPGYYQKQLDYTFNVLDSDTINVNDGVKNYIFGTNGSTRIIDLTNLSNKINKTLYTIYDNNNILTGIVNSYQFIIVPNKNMINKIIFGTDKTVNIYSDNGDIISHTNPEFTLSNISVEYIFKIVDNTINIYTFKTA